MKPEKVFPKGTQTVARYGDKNYLHTVTFPASSTEEPVTWKKGEDDVPASDIEFVTVTQVVMCERMIDASDELLCSDGRCFYAQIIEE